MNSQSKAETAQRRKIAGVSLLESLWHANTGTGTAVTAAAAAAVPLLLLLQLLPYESFRISL